MPLYEYQCNAAGHRFEVRHGVNDPRPAACPECGASVWRVIQPVGIVFKGAGFYATDSRKTKSAGAKGQAADNAAKGNGSVPEPASHEKASESKKDAGKDTGSGAGADTPA